MQYVGIPYKLHGRDINGVDCYGLVYLYLNHKGYTLPKYEINYTMTTAKEIIAQEYAVVLGERLQSAEDDCIVLLYRGNIPTHIGVCVGTNILHTTKHSDSVFESIKRIKRRFTYMEFYHVNKSYQPKKSI